MNSKKQEQFWQSILSIPLSVKKMYQHNSIQVRPIGHISFRKSNEGLNLASGLQKDDDFFATALAHEVRNPLSNINFAVEMLKNEHTKEEGETFLDVIIRASARINELVKTLLTHHQDLQMPSEDYSLHEIVDEVILLASDRILLKNIKVEKEYMTDTCFIHVDKQQIKIALTNIVINAIDAMSTYNGKLKFTTKYSNEKCFIEIDDNGIGISKKNLKQILKPFFSNKPGGMGLGLSTTKDILTSNCAGMDIQSVPALGTRFIISFNLIKHKLIPAA
jgi:signal transduction histidine kinase